MELISDETKQEQRKANANLFREDFPLTGDPTSDKNMQDGVNLIMLGYALYDREVKALKLTPAGHNRARIAQRAYNANPVKG